MKNKENAKRFVPKEDTYADSFTMNNGDKYDPDRQMITDLEINQMCIDIGKSKIDNFVLLLVEGEKVQKESVLENLLYYADSLANSLKVFQTIKKNYSHLTDCLHFMAEGIHKWMINTPTDANKECMEIIEEISYRTVSQNPTQVHDWEKVIEELGKIKELCFEKEWNYINGSFSVNSPPEKRRVAFCMIHHLMEVPILEQSESSKDIKNAAIGKILFFNQDTDPNTRYLICCIMKKVLEINPNEDEVWRAVWEYHRDKDENVRSYATQILCNLFYASNFNLLMSELDDENKEGVLSKNLGSLLVCYGAEIEENQKSNLVIISFINRIFKSGKVENICSLLDNLNTNSLDIIGENKIYENVSFDALPLMDVDVIEHFLIFYQSLQAIEFKEAIKSKLLKALKEVQYEVYGSSKEVAELLDLSQEDEVIIFLAICSKMLEVSKWYSLMPMLEVFSKLVMHQSLYEKVCSFLLKLWIGCPSFLQENVTDCALHLMLVNKRSLEFLITIREKILNSKFWNHRKSYILFYSTMKAETSFEYHKFIPVLAYKTMALDKSVGVRLTLTELIPKIYKYTEPANSTEKALMREAISKLEEDKDEFVKEGAINARKEIELSDKNHIWLAAAYERSRELAIKEQALGQVSYEPKRIIKTEHELLKMSKPKRVNTDKRKTINVMTKGMHREPSIENISVSSSKQTNTTAPKRSNLFRCHSVKIKAPVKKS